MNHARTTTAIETHGRMPALLPATHTEVMHASGRP